ncbi:hypothetical protein U14_00066 [Candidatus Moduliflexus flocculans]|uniref:Uncharacterized protein n=1 Tax=Candidatus Moduliflexus flocculans TaxID=1499966 RepID=A0A0S6VPK4_9BACT|nr:hypothetical protein U14_00066 [Candidatus Moduliflexus flocculans]
MRQATYRFLKQADRLFVFPLTQSNQAEIQRRFANPFEIVGLAPDGKRLIHVARRVLQQALIQVNNADMHCGAAFMQAFAKLLLNRQHIVIDIQGIDRFVCFGIDRAEIVEHDSFPPPVIQIAVNCGSGAKMLHAFRQTSNTRKRQPRRLKCPRLTAAAASERIEFAGLLEFFEGVPKFGGSIMFHSCLHQTIGISKQVGRIDGRFTWRFSDEIRIIRTQSSLNCVAIQRNVERRVGLFGYDNSEQGEFCAGERWGKLRVE